MKLIFCFAFILHLTACLSQETLFELESNQTMLMTGKGPGQDGAINPYYGSKSIAIINNVGKSYFQIRIQRKGEIIDILNIRKGEKKEITLLSDHELYFDAKDAARVKLDFKPADE